MQITIIRLLKDEVRSGKYCAPHYFLVPGGNAGNLMLGLDLMLTGKRNNIENQWNLKSTGKGLYIIPNRAQSDMALESSAMSHEPVISKVTGNDNQNLYIDILIHGKYL
jgi:hypothetical protein